MPDGRDRGRKFLAGSAPMQDLALARLGRLPIWPVAPTIEPIAGGRTNENFRVVAGGTSYFARVGVDLPHHGIRRVNEVLSNLLAANTGVAPAVIHAADGIMVTEFVEGRTLVQGEPLDDTTLLRLARMLRCLGEAVVPLDLPAFDPIAIVAAILARCRLLRSPTNAAGKPSRSLPQRRPLPTIA